MLKKTLISVALFSVTNAFAHDLMVLPNKSIVAGAPTTVAVDITASHGVYRFDKPVGADGIQVFDSEGNPVRNIGTVVKSASRTSFDLPITQDGTYKITYSTSYGGYMTSYTIGKRDTFKRIFANKSQAAKLVPEKAKNVETTKMSRYGFTYITSKTPTDAVITPKNKGFEIVPVTHPADYINGEEITMKVLMNGKPASDVDIDIKSEASLYSDDRNPIKLKTDKDGLVSTTFDNAGRYEAAFRYTADSTDPEADKELYMAFYTFEVVYE